MEIECDTNNIFFLLQGQGRPATLTLEEEEKCNVRINTTTSTTVITAINATTAATKPL